MLKLKKITFFSTIIIYKLSIDAIYKFLIAPYYSYAGLEYRPVTYKYITSLVLVILVTPLIIKLFKKNLPSAIIVVLFNLLYFIPGCTLWSLSNLNNDFFVYYTLYWIILMVFYFISPSIIFKRPSNNSSLFFFNIIIIFIVLVSLVITGIYNNFKLNFNLLNVYELRAEVEDMKLPLIIHYLRPLSSAIIPIACIYFLIEKKLKISLLLIFTQLLLFAFGGHKTTLFSIIIAILIYFFLKKKHIHLIVIGLICINIFSFIESYFSSDGFSYIAGIVQRRNFFLTNQISSMFFDFFSKNEFDYLRQSILGRIGFNSPYAIPISHVISIEYFRLDGGANNGLCGDAYCNFGWIGLLLYPFLINCALKFLDACSKDIDIRLLLVVCCIFSINFINGSFFTVLLTHGFLFTCIFLYVLPRNNKYKKK